MTAYPTSFDLTFAPRPASPLDDDLSDAFADLADAGLLTVGTYRIGGDGMAVPCTVLLTETDESFAGDDLGEERVRQAAITVPCATIPQPSVGDVFDAPDASPYAGRWTATHLSARTPASVTLVCAWSRRRVAREPGAAS